MNTSPPTPLILPFSQISEADVARVGGKGASLGAMASAGFPVPPGFCVTTEAFSRFLSGCAGLEALLQPLDALEPEDTQGARQLSQRLREHLEAQPFPEEIAQPLLAAWRALGAEHGYAVRSSATLEDLPDASFAGQQDTYLNVRGEQALLERVRACWASLFTERAVLYRRRHGYHSSAARLSVVVQRMVYPDVSGILFTADPVSGDRTVCSVDASYGLGEALVSGLVNADLYRVRKRTGELLEVRVGDKAHAIHSLPGGGTEKREVPQALRAARALNDRQLARLVELGRKVEEKRGSPQDVEWCIAGGELFLVQARPITSLFPLPEPRPRDTALHVYLSFGHLQANTAPLSPLSLSVFPLIIPLGKPSPEEPSAVVAHAAGRTYLDMTPALHHPLPARLLPQALASMVDPTLAERVRSVLARPEFRAGQGQVATSWGRILAFLAPILARLVGRLLLQDPRQARERYEEVLEAWSRQWEERLSAAPPGVERLRLARQALCRFFPEVMLRQSFPTLGVGVLSWRLLGRLMRGRVEARVVESLGRGLEGNVTTDMDLELGDIADLLREHPALVERLRQGEAAALTETGSQPGTERLGEAWRRFLSRYGSRCPGELDMALRRWEEDPSSLLTSLTGMLQEPQPGQHRSRHAAAVREAEQAATAILEAAGQGVGGWLRHRLVQALITRVRAYMALREHHKFFITRLLMQMRRAVLSAGEVAVARGLLGSAEDVWLLELDELMAALAAPAHSSLRERVEQRRREQARYAQLSPPPVLTSDGEAPRPPQSPQALPPGVLAGVAVSSGVVEGVARVVRDPTREVLRPGEILVATFTDPGWTPLFLHAGGLVMEVGGLMTHGSVVAREYGIPAVVGVEGALSRIKTGQRLRVDGERGHVTLLGPGEAYTGVAV